MSIIVITSTPSYLENELRENVWLHRVRNRVEVPLRLCNELPIVSIVVPVFTTSILRILKGNPKKELQWRL